MKKIILLFLFLIPAGQQLFAQVSDSLMEYGTPKEYTVGGITVKGAEYLDKDILILLSGIKKGQKIMIPGNDLSKCIQALWKQNLFADISINITKMVLDTVYLEYELQEKPRLSSFTFSGIRKGEQSDIREKIKLNKGQVLTDNIQVNIENTIKDYYDEKGFSHSSVTFKTVKDTILPNGVTLYITVTKGKRVKIDHILFNGNSAISSRKLHRTMKKTKEDQWYTVFSTSKFREKEYKDDKNKILELYNKKGFRDAYIISDSITENKNGNLNIQINISEGHKYYFRYITWKGNAKYSTGKLDTILRVRKGDVYNTEYFQRRLSADPNGSDVSSLYLDDGYLFFSATPVEMAITNDSVDIEIRIYEGPQATINEVNISGNDKTNENVIRRSLRTLPGNKFSRADVIRSQREIATLGFFNPEKIGIVPVPHPENGTVDINYTVEEKPSDQLELSAGYGGAAYGVTGALGLKFNNFSLKNMFTKGGWNPIPSGDGQQLAVRAQSNGKFYQSYNISFTEPWLGGKKPNSLSIAYYLSKLSTGYDKGDPLYGYLITNGVSVGYGKQLKWPDDYFTFISSIDYQNYRLRNYATTGFIISNGTSNELSFKQTIARNSLDENIFPHRGSSFSFSAQFTPPYSSLSGKDYSGFSAERKYKWIEYHKYRFNADWYTPMIGKDFILRTSAKLGYIGYYNKQIGTSPFEKFYVGGDGLSGVYTIYGKDIISQRGYEAYDAVNSALNPYRTGAAFFSKYMVEMRYPFSKNPNAYIYGLVFAEAANEWVDFKKFDPFKLNRSVGVGMRFLLPAFGLLGFNYGIPFDSQPGDPSSVRPKNFKDAFSRGKFTIVLGFEPE